MYCNCDAAKGVKQEETLKSYFILRIAGFTGGPTFTWKIYISEKACNTSFINMESTVNAV